MSHSNKYQTLKRMDHTHLWHPFTQMQEWMGEDPCIIAEGEGSYLIDVNGNRYLDGVSSLWCNLFGHRRPELDQALKAQTDRIAHSTFLGLSPRARHRAGPPGSRQLYRRTLPACSIRTAAPPPWRWPSSWRCSTGSSSARPKRPGSRDWRSPITGIRSEP